MKLNQTAKATLRDAGVSQAEWARLHWSDGKWHGDACGCPDDRCIGYHHDQADDCGCLPALLETRSAVPSRSRGGDRVSGPFETEQQAAALPAVREIYDAMGSITGLISDAQRQAIGGMCSALILEACERAGVELGAYDRRIIAWLGTWEAQTCAVIAGLISRAGDGAR